MSDTLAALLAAHPDAAPALGAPDRPWLTHGGLRALAARTREALAAAGIGRGDRVAIVLPNGPEMAAAFVTIAQSATTAPLNPAYRADEFDFYLSDLGAKAIVVPADYDGPALEAAGRHGLVVLRLAFDASAPAGGFTLSAEGSAAAVEGAEAQADDVALILHTSGTTSRPKIVPLLQRNVAASARHIGGIAGAHARGPLPQRHAALPHPRPARRGLLEPRGRRFDLVRARLQRASLLRLARRGEAHLVHGGADHAPGDPDPGRAQQGGDRGGAAPADPLQLGLAAAAGDAGARGDLRCPGDRELRDDRSDAPDDLEPACRRHPEGRLRRHRRWAHGADRRCRRANSSRSAAPARW
jgi:hypothetical protein